LIEGGLVYIPSEVTLVKKEGAGITAYRRLQEPLTTVCVGSCLSTSCHRVVFEGEVWFVENSDCYPLNTVREEER